MQKLIIGLVFCAHILAAHGQGTVHFNNRVPPFIDAKFFAPGGLVGYGAGYSAQIFAGPEGTAVAALNPVSPATTFRTGNAAGYVVPIDVVIPGVLPGEKATMVVRVFCGDVFETSWHFGMSNPITITLGGGLLPPANMVGLQSFTLLAANLPCAVPEPSTFILGLLGAIGLLFRRCFPRIR